MDYPVINVSWQDANAFCRWLCRFEKVPLGTYRLPTETEWEKAAKGGQNFLYSWGNQNPDQEKANYGKQWLGPFTLKKVGSFLSNAYGLYDMSGNVWEWCLDIYHEDFYSWNNQTNPLAQGLVGNRVLRGGDWSSRPSLLRCANRYYNEQNVRYCYNGFRIARSIDEPKVIS